MTDLPVDLDGWASNRLTWHFQRRLWSRWGIRLEHGEYSRILRLINRGHAPVLPGRDADPLRRAFVVNLRGRPVFVVAQTDALITALPPGAFEHRQGRWQVTRGLMPRDVHQALLAARAASAVGAKAGAP